jgi:branched-chain amino acid transport system ATP-binding protein
VRLAGEAIARPTVEGMVARGVALVPEKRELFGEYVDRGQPAAGRLLALAAGAARPGRAHAEVFAIFPRLQERGAPARGHPVGRASGRCSPSVAR